MQTAWAEWTLDQWLFDLEHRHATEIQLGLSRISEIAGRLNLLSPNATVVTVAGTNGKGSTVAALEALYHTAGYKVGTYTSPHLIEFNERIRVNTQSIDNDSLCRAFSVIEEVRDITHLTYFETVTLAALLIFKERQVDIIILEVGIGGRLDATNCIDTDLAIITTIDYDHQDYLGNTLEDIGYEKAGILRKDKPFIYADNNPPLSIRQVAAERAAPSYYYGEDYHITDQQKYWDLDLSSMTTREYLSHIPRPGIQLKSASAAILATRLLQDKFPLSGDHIRQAMKSLFIPGRLQFHQGDVSFLYDVSHNAQSARLLTDTLKKIKVEGQIHAVFSALKDKDLPALIFPLKDCVARWYPAQLDNKRASNPADLLAVFAKAEIAVEICYSSPLIAFEAALSQAKAGDLIVVYGSFYTVGQVMSAQHNPLRLKEIQ